MHVELRDVHPQIVFDYSFNPYLDYSPTKHSAIIEFNGDLTPAIEIETDAILSLSDGWTAEVSTVGNVSTNAIRDAPPCWWGVVGGVIRK